MLYFFQEGRKGFLGKRQVLAPDGERAPIARLAGGDMEDDAADQRLGSSFQYVSLAMPGSSWTKAAPGWPRLRPHRGRPVELIERSEGL